MSFQNSKLLHVPCFFTFYSSGQPLFLFKFKFFVLHTSLFPFICTLHKYSYVVIGGLVKLLLQSGQNHQILHGVSLAPTEQF